MLDAGSGRPVQLNKDSNGRVTNSPRKRACTSSSKTQRNKKVYKLGKYGRTLLGLLHGNSLADNSHMGSIRRKLCVLDVDVVRVYADFLSVRKYNGLSYREKEEKAW